MNILSFIRNDMNPLGFLKPQRNVNELICDLKNPNESTRWKSVDALVQIGETAQEFLLKAVAKRQFHSTYMKYVIAVFEKIGDSAIKPLITTLGNESKDLRYAAAVILGRIKESRAIEPLINALSDSDFGVRAASATALGTIGDKKVVIPLIKALKDTRWVVRMEAAKALGLIGDERAMIPLSSCYKRHNTHVCYDDEDVAEAAKKALINIVSKKS